MLKTILGTDGAHHIRVVPALFAYMFNRIDMEGFLDYLGERKEGTRIKDIARVNGYILKNCKLYAYACHCARQKGEQLPRAKDFHVAEKDARILRRLNLNHLDVKKFRPFSLDEFEATVDSMIASPEIRNNIGKFVTKKMSFLMKSYGMARYDIETMLKEKAVIAVYKQYPRYESYLHFINVAKAQIHNAGHTFITASTSKSQQKLIQNDDGSFEAVHVPLDSLITVAAPVDYGLEVRERLQALAQIEHRFSERTKEFLVCAAGVYNEGFSRFLKVGNDEAIEKMDYAKYMARLQAYFNASPENVERLFRNLRNRIHHCADTGDADASRSRGKKNGVRQTV
jgi:hypothetical protein